MRGYPYGPLFRFVAGKAGAFYGRKPMIAALPNLLSILRILFAVFLLFAGNPVGFATCYLICGISDVLDGWVARRWRLESRLGAKLDSLGDLVFWTVIFHLVYSRCPHLLEGWIPFFISGVVLVRAVNAVITRLRFRQWGMLHTWGNKVTGLLLYLLLPVYILLQNVPVGIAAVLLATAYLSAAEEMVILLMAKQYHPDRKSLFIQEKE